MKKINIILEGVSIEIPPLTKDSEGYLRGGFVGVGGDATISVANNGCTNPSCTNNACVNDGCSTTNKGPNSECTNNGCLNTGCTNNECKFTTATTETSKTAGIAFNGLLI